MMNIVAAQLLSFLLQDLLIEKGAIRIQQTKRLSENADLPLLPGGTRLHLGFVIALVVAVLGYVLLFRSALGVRLRAVGHNPHASRYAGHAGATKRRAGDGPQRRLCGDRRRGAGLRQ